ncbi:hypothetical protein NDU88_000594 [Pleurodeles waltl]|uniref:Uncharacterized protein n=1 Tax=Pleurodeles waltl TaxID=8319 RepID=A0AAV7UQY7_PLEWA|nr:hypothetical protein NDU88_000594 [Pleurodeles waltl]
MLDAVARVISRHHWRADAREEEEDPGVRAGDEEEQRDAGRSREEESQGKQSEEEEWRDTVRSGEEECQGKQREEEEDQEGKGSLRLSKKEKPEGAYRQPVPATFQEVRG